MQTLSNQCPQKRTMFKKDHTLLIILISFNLIIFSTLQTKANEQSYQWIVLHVKSIAIKWNKWKSFQKIKISLNFCANLGGICSRLDALGISYKATSMTSCYYARHLWLPTPYAQLTYWLDNYLHGKCFQQISSISLIDTFCTWFAWSMLPFLNINLLYT